MSECRHYAMQLHTDWKTYGMNRCIWCNWFSWHSWEGR